MILLVLWQEKNVIFIKIIIRIKTYKPKIDIVSLIQTMKFNTNKLGKLALLKKNLYFLVILEKEIM